MKVVDLMTRDVRTCQPSNTARDAAHLMMENDCGSIPIVDESQPSKVIGMVTDRDLCMAALRTGKRLEELQVGDAMSRNVQTCSAEDSLSDAERVMREARVRRLPVVDREGHLQGLLSIAQIARAAENSESTGVSEMEVGETLTSISQPGPGMASASS